MGKRHRRAYLSSYTVLVVHLLKWQFQPTRRSRSWSNTIERERAKIEVYEASLGGENRMNTAELERVYPRAVRDAVGETNLPLSTFPETCPYTIIQLRNYDYMPD